MNHRVAKDLSSSVRGTLQKLRTVTDKPLAVGFGISTPEHVRSVKHSGADAVIVGSALVSIIESHSKETANLGAILRKKFPPIKPLPVPESGGKWYFFYIEISMKGSVFFYPDDFRKHGFKSPRSHGSCSPS